MKRLILLGALLLSACGGVEGDSSTAYVVHAKVQPYRDIYKAAAAHCERYGKKAVLKARFSAMETVFECQ
jgi:hypothetical protein